MTLNAFQIRMPRLLRWVSMTYLQPFFPLLLILTIAGVFLARKSTRVPMVMAVLLFLLCWPPAAWVSLRLLEGPYRVGLPDTSGVQAMVVLASEVLPATALRPEPIPAWDTYQRCNHAAWLYRQGLHVPVIVSGHGTARRLIYADAMKALLVQQGVPAEMIITEGKARSTYENALYSAEILRQRGITRIALVTEAFHMRRAEMCFRKQGIQTVVAPCCFRSDEDEIEGWLPSARAVMNNQDSLHEAFGMAWYWMRGRI
jgi:uncharacterized SAM-binding protein YcdF (DUF218 family)